MANEMMAGYDAEAERIDLNLTEVVNEALTQLKLVRQNDLHLQIKVLAEVVTVSGFIVSHNMRQMVLQAVAQVRGVKGVVDSLYTDTDLAVAVSQILKLDPLTEHTYNIQVSSNQGIVMLTGVGATVKILEGAGSLPFRIAGVKAVLNHLSLSQ